MIMKNFKNKLKTMKRTFNKGIFMITKENFEGKTCPIMSTPTDQVKCIGPECAAWDSVFTTESIECDTCSIMIGPLLDETGHLPV